MGRSLGKPPLTPAEEADMLPPSKAAAASDLLPPEAELPPNADEATTAWVAPVASVPPIIKVEARSGVIPPLITDQRMSKVPQLSPEERERVRLWKNVILFGFFVAVLVVVFWAMAR